jgi:hypothetical protein
MELYKTLKGTRRRNMTKWEEWEEHCYEDLQNEGNIPFCYTQNTLIIPNTTKVTVTLMVIMMNFHLASKHSKVASSQHELDLSLVQ